MFFDTINKDELYDQYLVSIAKKQKELLSCRFDIETRKIKEFQMTGFLKKKCPLKDRYDKLLGELEELKKKTAAHRKKQGYSHGTFWWNLPWEQVEIYLLYDLEEINRDGKWRFEYTWKTKDMEDGMQALLLLEEGHYSDFSSSDTYHTGRISSYTLAEQKAMVRDFNNRQNAYALASLSINDEPVRSAVSGQEYASKADYYLSSEYYLTRSVMNDMYEQSLYQELVTTGVSAYSNSRHYECAYLIATYHATEFGSLDYVLINNFQYCGGSGSIDSNIENQYSGRDAAVACAFYLANSSKIAEVPMELFGMNIHKGALGHEELVRQAEIFTCLADKIKC